MKVKIVTFSDTHSQHKEVILPECDIALFAGDMSWVGEKSEIESFIAWFKRQSQCTFKVFIAGNHDKSFDPKYERETGGSTWLPEMFKQHRVNTDYNLYYLENNSVDLYGLKIWGSPITPWFGGDRWAFNKHRGDDIRKVWETIPDDIDILLTHGPAMHVLDFCQGSFVGCDDLSRFVKKIRPKYHIFGHIHEGYGQEEHIDTISINASICNPVYAPVNLPIIITIDK